MQIYHIFLRGDFKLFMLFGFVFPLRGMLHTACCIPVQGFLLRRLPLCLACTVAMVILAIYSGKGIVMQRHLATTKSTVVQKLHSMVKTLDIEKCCGVHDVKDLEIFELSTALHN